MAKYRGRTVKLNTPTRGDVKKFKVFVKDPKTGNVKKVNFEDRTFELFKVMFQNENKNVGTYVWCSESLNYATPDNNSFAADLIYTGENHRDCPIEVRRA